MKPRVRQQSPPVGSQDPPEMADVEGQSSDEEDVVEGELVGDYGRTPATTPANVKMAPAESRD